MNKLAITAMALLNFKGQRLLEVQIDGQPLTVFGDNATGKTTLADAWFWCLFGKDSKNQADFDIKTLNPVGDPLHNLNHSVELTLQSPQGEVRLSRTYREIYTKKRGSASSEFSGHTTDYAVNGVPVQANEYQNQVRLICDEKRFRLLSDPTYFSSAMPWQDRRRMLLEITGDVRYEDVIDSNASLVGIGKILGQHTPDQYKKIVASKLTALNDELKAIPVRIDEIGRAEIVPPAPGDHHGEIEKQSKLIELWQAEKANVTSGGRASELRLEISRAELEIERAKLALVASPNPARLEALAEQSKAKSELAEVKSRLDSDRRELTRLNGEISTLSAKLEAKRSEKAKEQESQWQGSTECSTCGQALLEERIESAKAKFNQARAAKLEAIVAEGKLLRSQHDEVTAKVAGLQMQIAAVENLIPGMEERLNAIEIPAEFAAPDPNQDSAFLEAATTKAKLQTELASLTESNSGEIDRLNLLIGEAQGKIEFAQRQIAARSAVEASRNRKAELEAKQKSLAAEYEKLQGHLYLIEQFIRAKVAMLTEKINSRFQIAKFKLFEEQVNGGLTECCEVTVDGVPYSSLNNGARINVGLDVINVLAEHLNFAPPIFIDNAESVTSIIETHGQQVRLVVSEQDKSLRFESAGKTIEANTTEAQQALAI